MSIDLDWSALDAELCRRCLIGINNALGSTNKPAFLGPILATSLSLGDSAPQLELVEIRDVYEEFLHVEDGEQEYGEHTGSKNEPLDRTEEPLVQPYLSNPKSPLSASWASRPPLGTPTMSGGLWMPRQHRRKASFNSSTNTGFPFPHLSNAGLGQTALSGGVDIERRSTASGASSYAGGASAARLNGIGERYLRDRDASPSALNPPNDLSVQMHFRVRYTGNMSLRVQTSVQVNYPALAFMSLPLSLHLSGIAFDGIVVVAYEGDRKRLHVSIIGPHNSQSASTMGSSLLTSIRVESEVGQFDKLVLKDVDRVEQFVLDLARKALQNEIAWPNFQSFAWT